MQNTTDQLVIFDDISILLIYVPLARIIQLLTSFEKPWIIFSHSDIDDPELKWLNSWMTRFSHIVVNVDKLESGWTDEVDGKV